MRATLKVLTSLIAAAATVSGTARGAAAQAAPGEDGPYLIRGATIVNPGRLASIRKPYFRSCQKMCIVSPYSYRSATMGSTRVARRAGT